MYTIFKGVWPFIYAMVIFPLLIILVPWISTFLPGLVVPAQELRSAEWRLLCLV